MRLNEETISCRFLTSLERRKSLLILAVLLAIAVVIVIRQPDMAAIAIGVTVLVPIIFVVQLIVGWLCLHNAEQPPVVEDEPVES